MDPSLLLNYEVIYETLSASESDTETDIPTDGNFPKGELVRVNQKRKVIKNFTICNPTANKRPSNIETTVRTNSDILSDLSSAKKSDNNPSDLYRCLINSNELNGEKPTLKATTSDLNDVNPLNGSIRKEKQKLKETNWANAVNGIGNGGPSMRDIKQVIEGTIFRVLNEDLEANANNNKNSAIDTSKKKCPHCEFQTLSRFSLKKHVALHENKPQLVFSQGIVEKRADTVGKTSLSAKKFVCCNCSDLFRTETALKFHKCVTLAQTTDSDNKINKVTAAQNSNINSSKESAIVTALKFLSQKPIDIETKREEVNINENSKIGDKKHFRKTLLDSKQIQQEVLLASTNRKAATSLKDDVVAKTKDVKYLRTILEEPAEDKNNSCPSVSSTSEPQVKMEEEIKIEPYEIVWESVKTECKDELFDENIKIEPEDSPQYDDCSSNMYDDLERRMAILTGEENNGASVEAQNWMGLSDNNSSDQREPIEELPIEIKYNALLLNNGKENTNSVTIVSNDLRTYPGVRVNSQNIATTNSKLIINKHKKINIGPLIHVADHFPGQQNVQNKTNSTSIKCKTCGRLYKSFSSLKTHEAIHYPGYTLCRICDYRTKVKLDLKKHYRKHHYDTYCRVFKSNDIPKEKRK